MEMDLCGHATLASAHVLWEQGLLDAESPAHFQTLSGPLAVVRRGSWLDMDFPTRPVVRANAPHGLAEALGEAPVFVGRAGNDYVVEVRSADAVRELRPDLAALERVKARGVAVTALSDDSRYATSYRGSSRRAPASLRTLSRARRTARSGPTGRRSWGRMSSSAIRRRAGPGSFT